MIGQSGAWRRRGEGTLWGSQCAIERNRWTPGVASRVPQSLEPSPLRCSTGPRTRTLGEQVLLSALVCGLVVSHGILMVGDTGSVYTVLIGGLAVTGVTGPTPGPGSVAGETSLFVLEFAPQTVWISGVGVAGPAPPLSFT